MAGAILQLEYNPKLNTTNEYTHATFGVSSERWVRSDGNNLHTTDKVTMKATCQHKITAFKWIKFLQIAAKRTRYTLSQQQQMQSCDWNTIPSSILPMITPMQCLVWNRRSWARNYGSNFAPLAKLQWKQCINRSLLLSYEWSVCKSQQRGQHIPSNNSRICRGSMSWWNTSLSKMQ